MSSHDARAIKPVSRHGGQAILALCALGALSALLVLVSEWRRMSDGDLGFFPPSINNGFWPLVLSFVGLIAIVSLSVSLLIHRGFG